MKKLLMLLVIISIMFLLNNCEKNLVNNNLSYNEKSDSFEDISIDSTIITFDYYNDFYGIIRTNSITELSKWAGITFPCVIKPNGISTNGKILINNMEVCTKNYTDLKINKLNKTIDSLIIIINKLNN